MTAQDVMQFVSLVGVPAAIAFYILWRIEPALSRLTESVHLLTIVVARMSGQDVLQIQAELIPAARRGRAS